MDKRTFIKNGLLAGSAAVLIPSWLQAEGGPSVLGPEVRVLSEPQKDEFTLPALPYDYAALEPYIDKQTMEIHHDRHHQTYVDKLNEAFSLMKHKEPSTPKPGDLEKIIKNISKYPVAIRNNAGGHFNHTFFWETLSPKAGQTPSGDLAAAINATFGDYQLFKDKFTDAAKSRFGSGWAWLCLNSKKKLFITSTPNQDNTLMNVSGIEKGWPIIGLDVWEHAYYLKYQNRRPDYIAAFFNVVDWAKASERYNKYMKA